MVVYLHVHGIVCPSTPCGATSSGPKGTLFCIRDSNTRQRKSKKNQLAEGMGSDVAEKGGGGPQPRSCSIKEKLTSKTIATDTVQLVDKICNLLDRLVLLHKVSRLDKVAQLIVIVILGSLVQEQQTLVDIWAQWQKKKKIGVRV